MNKHLLILVGGLIFAMPIFSQKPETASCEVRPVNSKLSVDGHQLMYALPKNTIHITIQLKQTQLLPGPYANYAEKYLNITDGIIHSENISYEIADINFEKNSYPDSSCFYCISCTGYLNMPELQLNSDGVILGCNLPYSVADYKIKENLVINTQKEPDPFYFYDLGASPFVEEKDETSFKTQQTDSTHVKVPVTISKLVPTSEENNAKEAADFIRKLRKRRLKLLVGLKDESFAVEGPAMQVMVNELEQLENKYLELFIGKTQTRDINYYFNVEPEANIESEQQILGWFSPNSGIVNSKPDVRKSDFKPLLLRSEVVGRVPDLTIQTMDNSTKNPVPVKYGLYYRIPGMISVSLQLADLMLAQQKMQVAQKGKVIPLPNDYLSTNQYGIEFYPESGALKKIIEKGTGK